MDYLEEIESLALKTLDKEKELGRAIAFNVAFRDSLLFKNNTNPDDIRHTVWNAVKRIIRSKKYTKEAVLLAGTRQMSEEAHETECPLV